MSQNRLVPSSMTMLICGYPLDARPNCTLRTPSRLTFPTRCDRDYDDTPITRQNTPNSLPTVRGVWVKTYGVIVSTDTCLHPQWTARFEPRGLMVAKPTELRAVGRLSG